MRAKSADLSAKQVWTAPQLKRLHADMSAVAGQVFAPGDGNSGSGKSLVPPGS